MVSKAVTQQDLTNLELKISKEQTELRHEDRNKMQQYYNIVDELKTDFALTNQAFTTMNENFRELKEMVKGISEKMDKQEEKFAGKWTEKILIFIGSAIGISIIGSIMALILIKNG